MRSRTLIAILFLACLPFLAVSCGGGGSDKNEVIRAKPSAKALAARKAAAAAAAAAAAKPALAQMDKRFEGKLLDAIKKKGSLRNPFKPIAPERSKGPKRPVRIKGPLECCPLNVFRLLAVITGLGEPKALVIAPDGKKYMVSTGDMIGNREGKIIEFYGNGIVVEETLLNPYGETESTSIVELTLPSTEDRAKMKDGK